MKADIKLEKNFDLSRFKLDLSTELNDIAGAIMEDHSRRLQHGQGVDMKMYKEKLKRKTVASKRAKGYPKPRIPLYATGMMSKIKHKQKATKSNQLAILKPANKRDEIGYYHQEGDGVPKREWFGITKKQDEKAIKNMERKINKIIDNV